MVLVGSVKTLPSSIGADSARFHVLTEKKAQRVIAHRSTVHHARQPHAAQQSRPLTQHLSAEWKLTDSGWSSVLIIVKIAKQKSPFHRDRCLLATSSAPGRSDVLISPGLPLLSSRQEGRMAKRGVEERRAENGGKSDP